MSAIAARKARLAELKAREDRIEPAQPLQTSSTSSVQAVSAPSPASAQKNGKRASSSASPGPDRTRPPKGRKRRTVASRELFTPRNTSNEPEEARINKAGRYFSGADDLEGDLDGLAESSDARSRGISPSGPPSIASSSDIDDDRNPAQEESAAVPTIKWYEPNSVDPTSSQGPSADPSSIVLRLSIGESVSIMGMAEIVLTGGVVEINGVRIAGPARELLICPDTSPLPIITAVEGQDQTGSIEIVLSPVMASGLSDLGSACPLAGADPFISRGVPGSQGMQRPFLKVITGADVRQGPQHVSHRSSSSWAKELARLPEVAGPHGRNKAPIFVVRGPKGAGKSTFARTATNVLRRRSGRPGQLDDVAFLDVDPGQSEFGTPGTISLYHFSDPSSTPPLVSPPWLTSLHPQPLLSCFIGQTTPRDVPSYYLASVAALVHTYQRDLAPRGVPLVVNTMGWSKGLGSDLHSRIEAMLSPSHIYDLSVTGITPLWGKAEAAIHDDRSSRYRAAGGGEKAETITLEALGSGVRSDGTQEHLKTLTAADQRTLSIITHLHAVSSGTSLPQWRFAEPLIDCRPYIVGIGRGQGLSGGIHFLPPTTESEVASVESRLSSINGELVGLALITGDEVVGADDAAHVDEPSSNYPAWRYAFTRSLPREPEHVRFLCLAVVRSVDIEAGAVHLLCPPAWTSLLPKKTGDLDAARPLRLAILHPGGSGASAGVNLPVWASLDKDCISAAKSGKLSANGGQRLSDKASLAGVPFAEVPYLSWPRAKVDADHPASSATPIGSERRRVRRNLMRKGQQM
ncbi:unnamed protein product [Jaminaea pallidilutea]